MANTMFSSGIHSLGAIRLGHLHDKDRVKGPLGLCAIAEDKVDNDPDIQFVPNITEDNSAALTGNDLLGDLARTR